MNTGDERLESILARLAPVVLPPADFPPAQIVRDTPREALRDRIRKNAEEVDIELTEAHREVIDFLLDFYTHCCETLAPRYTDMQAYWRYIDCLKDLPRLRHDVDPHFGTAY